MGFAVQFLDLSFALGIYLPTKGQGGSGVQLVDKFVKTILCTTIVILNVRCALSIFNPPDELLHSISVVRFQTPVSRQVSKSLVPLSNVPLLACAEAI